MSIYFKKTFYKGVCNLLLEKCPMPDTFWLDKGQFRSLQLELTDYTRVFISIMSIEFILKQKLTGRMLWLVKEVLFESFKRDSSVNQLIAMLHRAFSYYRVTFTELPLLGSLLSKNLFKSSDLFIKVREKLINRIYQSLINEDSDQSNFKFMEKELRRFINEIKRLVDFHKQTYSPIYDKILEELVKS